MPPHESESGQVRSSGEVCRICGARSAPLGRALVLARLEVRYFRCEQCGFTQTEQPYWLDLAYSDAIARTDVGLVRRNLVLAEITQAIIASEFDADATFVDYGGGYGLFVRLLRDAGFDFRWLDPHATNVFARDLEADETHGRFELLTAFEVFEHLASPVAAVESMLRLSSSILFSTLLLPRSAPRPGEWWYYALESGQHVALYSLASLQALARNFGLRLYTDGESLHLLTDRKIADWQFRLRCRYRIAKLLNLGSRQRSLTDADHERATRAIHEESVREVGTHSVRADDSLD